MNFFDKTAEGTAQELKTDLAAGLSAQQVDERIKTHGYNRLEGAKEKSIFSSPNRIITSKESS